MDAVLSGGGKLPELIEAQYNPSELTLQKGAQIAEQNIPGLDSPLLQFIRGQTEKLSVELTLDEGSTPPYGMPFKLLLESLYQLVKVQPKTHAPPRVEVVWGWALPFPAVTESVQRKFTLFDRAGNPTRAVVSLSFRGFRTLDTQLKELNLQSSDHTKLTVVRAGDRLDTIAFREYGDSGVWPDVAAFNRIENARRLIPGTTLRLPPLEELLALGRVG